MPSTEYWSASEYYNAFQSLEDQRNVGVIETALQEYAGSRNPTLLDLCPAMYRLPVTSAIWMYEQNPGQHRETLLAAAGPPHSPGLWPRLATLGMAVSKQRDYYLLGRLAFLCEFAAQVERLVPEDRRGYDLHALASENKALPLAATQIESQGDATSRSLLEAFTRAFDLAGRRIRLEDYCAGLVGYLTSLPVSFLIPTNLVFPAEIAKRREGTSPQDWRLLRQFWTHHPEHLHRYPEKLAALRASSHAVVAAWAANLPPLPTLPPRAASKSGSPHATTPVDISNDDELEIELAPMPGTPFDSMAVLTPPPLPTGYVPRKPRRRPAGFFAQAWTAVKGLFGR